MQKFLIVNADDFGLSEGVNRGILQAHRHGIVTSASLMVRGAAAAAAAAHAKEHPRLGVGLHVDLCEWRCVNDVWTLAYEVVPLADERAVAAEIDRQLTRFRELMGRDPDHLNSHQHVHNEEPARSLLIRRAKEIGVVLRQTDPRVRYCGDFYGQSDKGYAYPEGISAAALSGILRGLTPGITELCCHPGLDATLDSIYRAEREQECAALSDPGVLTTIAAEAIQLVTFATAPLTGP